MELYTLKWQLLEQISGPAEMLVMFPASQTEVSESDACLHFLLIQNPESNSDRPGSWVPVPMQETWITFLASSLSLSLDPTLAILESELLHGSSHALFLKLKISK